MEFHKMHGLGNDFIVIDSRSADIDLTACNWQQLADRRLGIGCDQILILTQGDAGATASYLVRNADGSVAEQCGNGIRCLALYLQMQGEVTTKEFILSGPAGAVRVQCQAGGTYRINMGQPVFAADKIPLLLTASESIYSIPTSHGEISCGAVSMGNPHAVIIDHPEFSEPLGAEVSQHATFPMGCNVGFATVLDRTAIKLQVYERGTGPTLACGSGACAAVAVLRSIDRVDERVRVDQPGGTLVIEWPGKEDDLWMSGPATYVYQGIIDL